MNHSQANDLLTGFISGVLDPSSRHEVEQHVADCEDCRSWVATYRFFSEALQDPVASPAEHLSSHELCAFILTPGSLDAVTRLRCEQHLEVCSRCRREQTLVREAVAAAREVRGSLAIFAGGRGATKWPTRLAMAASLLLLIGALAVLSVQRNPDEYTLRSGRLEGRQTYKATDSIVIEATEVSPGALLTLQAGEKVAFGEGFSVRSDATLKVFVGPKRPVKQDAEVEP
jgi:hypothetical protein